MHVVLPPTAKKNLLIFDDQGGRDQVALAAQKDWSDFERPLPEIIHASAIRFPGLMIDVGANSGYYALLAALSGNTRVLAFEPETAALSLLRKNVSANALQERIEISHLALSDKSGTARLFVPTQEHGLVECSSSLEETFKPAHSEVRSVPMITMDEFLGRLKYRFRRVSLLKIDVEGHEAAVLRGSIRTIRRHRPIIFIEVLSVADLSFLSGFIADHNYTDIPLNGDLSAPGKNVEYLASAWNHALVPDEKREIFLGVMGQTKLALPA